MPTVTRDGIGLHYETDGTGVRYTTIDESVYAFLFGWPDVVRLELAGHIALEPEFDVELLTAEGPSPLEWATEDDTLRVELPEEPPEGTHDAAYGLRVQAAFEGGDAMARARVDPDPVESIEEVPSFAADDYDDSDWDL